MKKDKNRGQGLPLLSIKEIPEVQPGAKKITGLVRTGGMISGYQLSDGKILSKEQGVELARQGQIAGVGIGINRGTEYLKSLPDSTEGNNLGNLPTIPKPSGE